MVEGVEGRSVDDILHEGKRPEDPSLHQDKLSERGVRVCKACATQERSFQHRNLVTVLCVQIIQVSLTSAVAPKKVMWSKRLHDTGPTWNINCFSRLPQQMARMR